MSLRNVFFAVYLVAVLCCGRLPLNAEATDQVRLAVVDSGRLLRTLAQQYEIASLILSDYQDIARRVQAVKGKEKEIEEKLNSTLEEILVFYAVQLMRPMMIETNRLVSDKKFIAVVNKNTFKLEEVLLAGTDTRRSSDIPQRNPALAELEQPFTRGIYFAECPVVEITDALLPSIERHFHTTPISRFALPTSAEEDRK